MQFSSTKNKKSLVDSYNIESEGFSRIQTILINEYYADYLKLSAVVD